MPPKRKAVSHEPEVENVKKTTKKQQSTPAAQVAAPTQHKDFGSAFEALLSAPVPKAVPQPETVTTVKTSLKTTTTRQNDTKNQKGTNNKQDSKQQQQKGTQGKDKSSKFDKKRGKRNDSDDEDANDVSSRFAAVKAKRQQASQTVVTISREESEKQQLANQYAREQKQREKEKALLFEKDHMKPQYDDTEKQLVRIATKGVVALFQAVYDQTQKMKEINRATSLSMTARDKLINDETQSGFLELLKQASETTAKAEPVYVPNNKKKFSDLKSKLENDEDINWDDLKGMGLSDDEDGDDGIKKETGSSQYASNSLKKNALGSKNMIQESSDSEDDDSAVPKFRRQALQRQKEQKEAQLKVAAKKGTGASGVNKNVGKWSVLDDDYVQAKSSGKMKDWEKDETSDSDL